MSPFSGSNPIGDGLRRFVSRAGATFVVQGAGCGLMFLVHAVFARRFGVEDYGVFAHMVAIAGLLAVLAPLGWNTAIIRLIVQYRENKDAGLLRGVWRRGNQATTAVSLVLAGLLAGLSLFAALPAGLSLSLFGAAFLLPLMAGLDLRRRALQGLGATATSLLPEFVLLPVLAIAFLAIASSFGVLSPRALLFGYVACASIGVAVAQIQLVWALPANAKRACPTYETRLWYAIALPMAVSSLSYLAMNRMDVVVLGMLSDMRDVGIYSAAKRIVMVGAFVQGALNIVAGPALAAAHQSEDKLQFQMLVRRVRLLSCAVGIPWTVVALSFPGLLLSFFGVADSQANFIIQILTLGVVGNIAAGPVGLALIMSSRERSHALISGVTTLATVVALVAVARFWGGPGAACVIAGGTLVQNVAMWLVLWSAKRPAARSAQVPHVQGPHVQPAHAAAGEGTKALGVN